MLDKISGLLDRWSEIGIKLPSAYDNRTGKGSISLLFAHVANFVAILSICYLVSQDSKYGVLSAIVYSTLMLAFYLIRTLSKFKVDIDDGEIELDSQDNLLVKEENADNKSSPS